MSGRNVLVTGVSSGIGLGLVRELLDRGDHVYGTSRNTPDLGKVPNFHFVPCDLNRNNEIEPAIQRLLAGVTELELVILNAGILGHFGDLSEQTHEESLRVMQVNVWANQEILKTLFALEIRIRQVVAISSSAGVHLSRGWGAYGISKSALNALIQLASREHPDTHFCSLAPSPVDTGMQDQLLSLPKDERYPSLERLRLKRGTSEMPESSEYAPHLLSGIERLPDLVDTGAYADLRVLDAEMQV